MLRAVADGGRPATGTRGSEIPDGRAIMLASSSVAGARQVGAVQTDNDGRFSFPTSGGSSDATKPRKTQNDSSRTSGNVTAMMHTATAAIRWYDGVPSLFVSLYR